MKTYAVHLKNIAAFIMLLALIALLLPFGKITAPGKSTTVSGFELIKTGAGLSYEYYSKGTVDDNYVIKDSVTWGDIKSGADYAGEQAQIKKIAVVSAICVLPILFCFFAMLFTFMAIGKKTMLLPTLLIALAFLENIIMIGGFSSIMKTMLSLASVAGVSITMQIGIYAFAVLCGIALFILIVLWVIGGFNKPRRRRRGDSDDDGDDDSGKKKNRSSKKDRVRKKRRRRKKSKGRRKKKGSKDKGNNKEDDSQGDSQDDSQNDSQNATDESEQTAFDAATGHLTGTSGIYKGTDIDLAKNENGTITIGTTQEAINQIFSGNSVNLDGCSCTIDFNAAKNQYTITSHSTDNIILQSVNDKKNLIHLTNGKSQSVGADTIMYVADVNNSIKLS